MQKDILPLKGPLHAAVTIPGSKSLTNRALVLAALAQGVSSLSGVLISDDTTAMMNALRALGIAVVTDEGHGDCIVIGCGGQFPRSEALIDCQDAGTVARFLPALCATRPGHYHFEGTKQLSTRPMSGLLHALRRQRVQIECMGKEGQLPFTMTGADRLPGGELEIEASASGQFVSAMLMAAPFAGSAVTIEARDAPSMPFIHMTIEMMGLFGVRVQRLHPTRFSVPVPQRYTACDYAVEPDLSTAACFFAAAAVMNGEVTIQPVDLLGSLQGDARFVTFLQQMGCEILPSMEGLTVRGTGKLQGISVSMRDCSDTFMALAAIAPFAVTPTTITNIGHTRRQESDRIQAMSQGLQALGVRVEQGPDWLRIHPSEPKAGIVDACRDHRIAMALAVIGLKTGVTIKGGECVTKTCPTFFSLWDKMSRS